MSHRIRNATILLPFLLVAATTTTGAATEETGATTLRETLRELKPAGRLDTHLDQLAHASPTTDTASVASSAQLAGPSGTVSLVLRTHDVDTDAVESRVLAASGSILHTAPGVIEARVSPERLVDLVADDRILSARTLFGPLADGPLASGSGAEAVGPDADVRAILGVPDHLRGRGVRVGIIDVGFGGYSDLLGTVLPEPAAVRCYHDFGDFDDRLETCEQPPSLFLGSAPSHGAAVAEAIVDVAPEVELYLADPPSLLDLRETVDWMIEQGVDVINHSLYRLYEGPGDGTSPGAASVYETIDRATTSGTVWVGAAGNLAEGHWLGGFSDTNDDGIHEPAPGESSTCIDVDAGDLVVASLRWDDVWTAPLTDLDLALTGEGGVLAASADRQDGATGQMPIETLVYDAESAGRLCLSIVLAEGAPPEWLELASFRHALSIATPEGSLVAPADAAGAVAVGATPWFEPTRIEPFSSWGPTTDERLKPDLVAFDRRPSEVLGGGSFRGTSQAAPHVSGLFAVAREAMPSLGAAQLVDLFAASATAPTGAEPEAWGHGLARFPLEPEAENAACIDGAVCLGGGRYELRVEWTTPDARTGIARSRALTADSAVFTFFDPSNVELLVKVLDGCSINQRHWVYAAGLTDLAVVLTVTDRLTGERRVYRHEGGEAFRTVRDADALGGCDRSSGGTGVEPELSAGGWSETVDLADGFRVSVRWDDGDAPRTATGQRIGSDSTVFTFFDRDNVELVIKLLDGRRVNGSWWVFASGPTDVGVEIVVEDLKSGQARTWRQPTGRPFAPILDVEAFER